MVGYQEKVEVQLDSSQIFAAGAVAGIVSRSVSQPFDVLKVKFQLQVEPLRGSSSVSKYQTLLQALRVIWKEEGLLAFWSGHNPGQVLSLVYGATNFGAFELFTRASCDHLGLTRDTSMDFICGMASGTVATVASHPFDVLRTRFIAQELTTGQHTTMFGGLMKMVSSEGITSPYKGLLPALMQGAPLIGVSFATYGLVKSIFEKYDLLSRSASSLNFSGEMIAGGAAGFLSKTVVYPLDLARRRLEFQGFQEARVGYGQNFTCRGLVDCFKATIAREGLRGLYKGFIPSAVKTTFSTSIQFTVYEELCQFLRK